MVKGYFAVEGAKFDEIPLVFNAPAITEAYEMAQAIDDMQVSLVPQLRKALIQLHDSFDAFGELTGIDAYLRVRAPKPTKNNANPGEDARLYLREGGRQVGRRKSLQCLDVLDVGYSHLSDSAADKKMKHFWETIWLRRREPEDLGIVYFDSGTASWDRPEGEEEDGVMEM